MKKTTIIRLIILAYVLCGVGLYFGTEFHLDRKTKRLRTEAMHNLEQFFAKQRKYVSVAYSGKKVSYKEISVPKRFDPHVYSPERISVENEYGPNEEWEERWGDIYSLYELKPKSDSDNQWAGWMFVVIEWVSNDCFRVSQVYPNRVGYRYQASYWDYYHMPSVQSAVDEAFEFYTTDKKSNFYEYMTDSVTAFDVMNAVENEYFDCFSYDLIVRWYGQETADSIMANTDWEKYGWGDGCLYKAENQYKSYYGYMQNGYYKVFNRIVPIYYYQIKYKHAWDPRASDKKKILIWGYSILTLLLLAAVVPLSVSMVRKKRKNRMSLKERLLYECNPSRFMKPYDEVKVATANELYEATVAVSDDDVDELKALRKRAAEKLGVSFVDQDLLNELISVANPKNFTKPYDPEKVRIANRIYNRLVSEELDVDEVDDLQNEIKEKLQGDNQSK